MKRSLLVILSALVLVLAACAADGSDATDDGSDAGADVPATTDGPAAPTDDGDAAVSGPAPGTDDAPPPAAGACLAGAEDCDDIPGNEAPALPADEAPDPDIDADDQPIVVTDMSVADALETDAVGIIAVRGFVIADAEGIRLCEALAESLPPQCGGASIGLTTLDTVDPDSITEAQGVQWTDELTTIIGQLVDGELVPEV